MDRLTQPQLTALLEFVRETYACRDRDGFITHLVRALPTVIAAEITGYSQINAQTRVASGVWEPANARFPTDEQIFAQYMVEHPIITHCQQTGDGHALKISDFITQRQFHRLGLYNEFFRPYDMEHQMSALLAASPPLHTAITFSRSRRDFSERDRLLLNLLRPHLAQAYSNAEAVTQMQQETALLRQAMEASDHGMVVLTRDGRVRLMTQQARAWLTEYFGGPSRSADHLPESLSAWITHQEAQLDHADDTPPPRTPLTVERDGARLVVRHLCEAEQCLLLLEERRASVQPASFASFGLTHREAEVLQWVAQGKTNAEIGVVLSLSSRTVQKHLEHIFEKLGVETRLAAVTMAMGPCSGV